jgi:hypothetical protein
MRGMEPKFNGKHNITQTDQAQGRPALPRHGPEPIQRRGQALSH